MVIFKSGVDVGALALRLIVVGAILASAFGGGWVTRGWREADVKLKAQNRLVGELLDTIDRERQTAVAVQAQLDKEREQRETDRLAFQEELRNVSNDQLVKCVSKPRQRRSPRSAPQPAPAKKVTSATAPAGDVDSLYGEAVEGGVPPVAGDDYLAVAFQPDFIRLWNDALATGATPTERESKPDVATAGPGVVDAKEVLANLQQNSERWAQCRTQVRQWQETAKMNGWTGVVHSP